MSNLEKLQAMGADIVGGELYKRHTLLGTFQAGELQLTEEGRKLLAVDDAVVVEKPTKAAKGQKAKSAPAEAEPVALDLGDLDNLNLGDE